MRNTLRRPHPQRSVYGAAMSAGSFMSPEEVSSKQTSKERKLDDENKMIEAQKIVANAVSRDRFNALDKLHVAAHTLAIVGIGNARAKARSVIADDKEYRRGDNVLRHKKPQNVVISAENAHRRRLARYLTGYAAVGAVALGISTGITPDKYPGVGTLRTSVADTLLPGDFQIVRGPEDVIPGLPNVDNIPAQGTVPLPETAPSQDSITGVEIGE